MKVLFAIWLAVFSLQFAPPAASQSHAFINDYEALFSRHADEIVKTPQERGPPLRRLLLSGGVIIQDVGPPENRRIEGFQSGSDIATGCLFLIAAELSARISICPDLTTPENTEYLQDTLRKFAAYYAENAEPKRPISVVEALFSEGINQMAQSLADNEPKLCEHPESTRYYIGIVTSSTFKAWLEEAFSVARLPVENPCL